MLEGDLGSMQKKLKELHESEGREEELSQLFAMSSLEVMRARCRIPQDVGKMYEALNKMGLQYGPAFRLLTDVYVTDNAE